MILLKNICFSYYSELFKLKTKVFENFNAQFDKDKIYTLTAPNGYGKTTLLKIIAGFLVPQKGELRIENSVVDFKNFPYDKISIFYNQERVFYNQLTVKENLYFYGFSNMEGIINGLTYVNLKTEFLYEKFENLSSGNKAKAVLIKNIMENKPIMLLDEPFSYLDPESKESIKRYLTEIKKERCVIIATNNEKEIKEISDETIRMIDVK
ncbi:MAG: ATP-binding cassette domain-containing protein [Elusimicrobiota bacterium]